MLRVHKLLKTIITIILLTAMTALSGCTGSYVDVDASMEDGTGSNLIQHEKSSETEYIYGIAMDENSAVITACAADIYASPDVKSDRLTQVLYNQPVSVLQRETGWLKVYTVDGTAGWMKSKYADSDISSLNGRAFTHKIIVTSRSKPVTSTPSGGITHMTAPMGTEFFAFNNDADTYEVYLPENKTGWIRGSGIIHIGLDEKIPVTNPEDFSATALRLKGTSYLINGKSEMGIDGSGLVYICARINGIDLPRTLAGQLDVGTEIRPDEACAGDLVFMSGTGEGEEDTISGAGICVGGGNYIYAGGRTGYVAVDDIKKENADGRVVAARRIFN